MCLCYSDSEEKGGKKHFGVQNKTKQQQNETAWEVNVLAGEWTRKRFNLSFQQKQKQPKSFFLLSFFLDDISGGEFPSNFDENCFCKKHFSAQTWKKCFILFHHEFQHWSFYVVKLSVRFLFGSLPAVRWSLKVYFVIE